MLMLFLFVRIFFENDDDGEEEEEKVLTTQQQAGLGRRPLFSVVFGGGTQQDYCWFFSQLSSVGAYFWIPCKKEILKLLNK
jgi:hypothetical protein